MQASEHLKHAIQVAADAHEGQMDKAGKPYFEHCQRVAAAVAGDQAKTVAYLHDVAEKGRSWTLDRLKEEGFSQAVLSAVDALTRRRDEPEDVFIRRAISNPLARLVKRADLEDNRWQVEMTGGDPAKYEAGLEILVRDSRLVKKERDEW